MIDQNIIRAQLVPTRGPSTSRLIAGDQMTFYAGKDAFDNALSGPQVLKAGFSAQELTSSRNVLEVAYDAVGQVLANKRLVLASTGFPIPAPDEMYDSFPKDRELLIFGRLKYSRIKGFEFDDEFYSIDGPKINPKSKMVFFSKQPFGLSITRRVSPIFSHSRPGQGNEGLLVVTTADTLNENESFESVKSLASFFAQALTNRVKFIYPNYPNSIIEPQDAVLASMVDHATSVYLQRVQKKV